MYYTKDFKQNKIQLIDFNFLNATKFQSFFFKGGRGGWGTTSLWSCEMFHFSWQAEEEEEDEEVDDDDDAYVGIDVSMIGKGLSIFHSGYILIGTWKEL